MTTEHKTLDQYFKCLPDWQHALTPKNVLEKIAFVFTLRGNRYRELYFKLKEPLPDDHDCGMDCFQFSFDTDNGIWLHDGDMKFNNFMGAEITDSGADVVGFIKEFLIKNNLSNLIL